MKWGDVHEAARYNNVGALKVFLDAGVPVDCDARGFAHTPPLTYAIWNRAYEAAAFLLDAGTAINDESRPLIAAVYEGDLKMVKMLLERGADIHITFRGDDKVQYNALKMAVIHEHHEVADYLRSQGAVMPEEEDIPPCDPADEVIEALSGWFKGKPEPLGVGEIVPASVPLTVRIFPPVKGKRKSTAFVTSGLMEYALVVPKGKNKYRFAEYFIEMPGAWPVTSKDLERDENFWPIAWLKAIGRYPHENKTYYGEKKTVKSAKIPALTTPNGEYDSALVERVTDLDIETSDGRNVQIYRVTPLLSSKKT
jgi:hypothetical protein